MTVAELAAILRTLDPSRTVVIAGQVKGRLRAVPVKRAEERILQPSEGGFVALDSLTNPHRASVFVVEA